MMEILISKPFTWANLFVHDHPFMWSLMMEVRPDCFWWAFNFWSRGEKVCSTYY